MNTKYNDSPFYYSRRETREVKVGNVGVGGHNPIRIQSMTNTDTMDTEGTVKQTIELYEAGCEIVRITAPSTKDAENLKNIRRELDRKGYNKIPLVADIHFSPAAAILAAEYVDKVRINPGNYTDKKKFAVREYTDHEYAEELERAEEAFFPLLKKCSELGRAIRIGTNHGSLSDRIMNRYGDTALGMVESALEFIQFAEKQSFYDIIISMKASNPKVMIQAYRMLSARFLELNMDYPLHLGVTEAGDGQDGRIRSAVGIGSLLEDGLGDTIRVSLTEDPVEEIPVAKLLAAKYNHPFLVEKKVTSYTEFRNPYEYKRFYSREIDLGSIRVGDEEPVRVEVCFSPESFSGWLRMIDELKERMEGMEARPEIFHCNISSIEFMKDMSVYLKNSNSTDILSVCLNLPEKLFHELESLYLPAKIVINPFKYDFKQLLSIILPKVKILELKIASTDIIRIPEIITFLQESKYTNVCFSLGADHNQLHEYRKLVFQLRNDDFPVTLTSNFKLRDDSLYNSSIHFGALLEDGIGDSLRIESDAMSPYELNVLTYDILQVCGLRSIKTEFISCPSCGRTQFNIQDTLARIRKRTGHLKGVKIAVMGCIVNGPGEMADADYGYVGAGSRKVHLYKQKTIVEKSIPDSIAEERLIELIKADGKWVDP